VPDNPSVPWAQPDNWVYAGPASLTNVCTVFSSQPLADQGAADCAVVTI